MKVDLKKPLLFYFDTNVLLDLVRKRRPAASKLFDKIKLHDDVCSSSQFAYMEMVEIEKLQVYARKLLIEGKKDVNQICREYRKCSLEPVELTEIENEFDNMVFFDFIKFINLNEDSWKVAKELTLETNISTPDCIHLAIVGTTDADYFVTSDTDLIRMAHEQNFDTITPEKALEVYE